MDDRLVTIATFYTPVDAALAKHQLEADGIEAHITDEATANMAWHLTVAIGWIKLQVAPSDAKRAMAILQENHQLNEQLLPEDEDDDEIIEKLSSADRMVEQAFRTAIIGLLFFPLQFYSLWLLLRLLVSPRLRRRISGKRYWKILVAIALDIIALIYLWVILSPLF